MGYIVGVFVILIGIVALISGAKGTGGAGLLGSVFGGGATKTGTVAGGALGGAGLLSSTSSSPGAASSAPGTPNLDQAVTQALGGLSAGPPQAA